MCTIFFYRKVLNKLTSVFNNPVKWWVIINWIQITYIVLKKLYRFFSNLKKSMYTKYINIILYTI